MILDFFFFSLEQFNDVLRQENVSSYDISSCLFDSVALNSIPDKQSISVEVLKVCSQAA